VDDLFQNPISAATRFCAVYGQPIRHSGSPAMHNAALAKLGLDWRYLAFEVNPDALGQAQPTGGTHLVPMLHELAEKARRRALVVILSDCFCDGDELRDALQHLRFQKHDLALFHLLDPLELDFEFDRPVRFVDMEGSHSIVTEPATVRAEYQSQLKRFLDKLRDDCHEFNADYRRVTLNQPYGQVMADFLTERARHATRA